MATQSFTFFFTVDAHRASDHSQSPTWSLPKTSSSTAPRPVTWVAPPRS